MVNKHSNVILIFVKNPEKGHVKTRLAKSIGDSKALQVYKNLLKITKNITLEIQADRQVWYSQSIAENDIWDRQYFSKYLQKGEDLGKRMSYGFQQVFDQKYSKAVIIGSDCADLTSDIIKEAFRALDYHDVVIGPAEDGGYYLLGMTHFIPSLFEDKAWSQDSLFKQTITDLKQQSKSFFQLPTLNDIDNVEDLHNSTNISI